MNQAPRWWQRSIIYQVYPRSFQDTNGDGIGDLEGIIRRLDYLQWLGISAIWISPIYPSPMVDFGYDISDFKDVHPMFGTLPDLDRLIAEAAARDIRVILDFVPNHTSDLHPWFIEARRSAANAYHDWYVWHPGKPDGSPPNNWRSTFGGPAWQWNQQTGEYYYHAFLPQQPDLNWRNREVREAMFEVMRYWFDRGVAGLRIDVVWHLVTDDAFRDNPPNPRWRPGDPDAQQFLPAFTNDQPEVIDIVHDMRSIADEYDGDRLLIGEIYLPLDRLVAYYGQEGGGLHLPYNFQLLLTEWNAPAVSQVVNRYESLLPRFAWPNWVLSNHDRPRVATRIGPEQARVAALLLLALRGTPTIYYGDELGMQDGEIPRERIQDPVERTWPGRGRDPQRTPMQWDSSPAAGFSEVDPWLPVAAGAPRHNVASERKDPASMLALYRRLVELRRSSPALQEGAYRFIESTRQTFTFERRQGDERWIAVANFSDTPAQGAASAGFAGRIALSTCMDRVGEVCGDAIELRPNEAVLVRLD